MLSSPSLLKETGHANNMSLYKRHLCAVHIMLSDIPVLHVMFAINNTFSLRTNISVCSCDNVVDFTTSIWYNSVIHEMMLGEVMLSDNAVKKEQRTGRRRAAGSTGKHWSDSQKIEAVQLAMTLGSLPLVSKTLKIPDETLRRWRLTQWWKDIEKDLKYQTNLQFSASAKAVIDKSMAVIADRLENGDWIYDQKAGQMVRKPVAMKDALSVADKMMDKKLLLDKMDVKEESSEGVEDKLQKLMDRFTALATGIKHQPPVEDVKFTEEASNGSVECV